MEVHCQETLGLTSTSPHFAYLGTRGGSFWSRFRQSCKCQGQRVIDVHEMQTASCQRASMWGIARWICEESPEPNKTKMVKLGLIWVVVHEVMQLNEGHTVYLDCLTEIESARPWQEATTLSCMSLFVTVVSCLIAKLEHNKSKVPTLEEDPRLF